MRILNKNDESVIFEAECETIRDCVMLARKNHINLSDANFVGAYLANIDLNCARLSGANFAGANLSGADLHCADLHGANLQRANLCRTDFEGATLHYANLSDAEAARANFEDANLYDANLSGINLVKANLRNTNLETADITGAKLPHFNITPQKGSFIAYKIVRCLEESRYGEYCILELEIPDDANRTSSLVGRKCRADKVRVLAAYDLDGKKVANVLFRSTHKRQFTYTVGEVVTEYSYNSDIRVECTTGIHFFMTLEEAKEYR